MFKLDNPMNFHKIRTCARYEIPYLKRRWIAAPTFGGFTFILSRLELPTATGFPREVLAYPVLRTNEAS
jgi:hypothetical protein